MAAPAADQPHILRQVGLQDVAPRRVRVLDQDLLGARRVGAVARRQHLARHLLAMLGIVGVRLARLVPVGDAGGALDVGADEDLHATPLCKRAPLYQAVGIRPAPRYGRPLDHGLRSIMGKTELWQWDAVDLAKAIRLRKISSHEATK